MSWSVGVVVTLALLVCACVCVSDASDFINQFAVKVNGNRQEVEEIAKSLGFKVEHELRSIKAFLMSHPEVDHRSKRSADTHVDILNAHPKVLYAQQEQLLIREKREIIHDKQIELPIREITDDSVYHRVQEARLSERSGSLEYVEQFTDPKFHDQWYLRNYGQSAGKVGMDLNVDPAWNNGFTGTDVIICILDDGIDHQHEDLRDNYDPAASTDLNDLDDLENDPMPDKSNSLNSHGTRCAGEIASSAHNDNCGVGVAFTAKIGGVRILDGNITDSLEAAALVFNNEYIDIYSASWGPKDDGRTMARPGTMASEALRKGVTEGRGGLGSIYVWATGNGGLYEDDCSADGYVSSIESMSFGSVTDKGERPYFMEICTSTLAVVPSGGEVVKGEEQEMGITKLKVVTTDINGGCIENFQGTSSAAPLAAGCVALALQANPSLTWRDVQHIVVHSSRIPSVDHSWVVNGAGLHVSHKFGFGVLDASRMVELAQNWVTVPEQHVCRYHQESVNKQITSKGKVIDEIEVTGCTGERNRIHNLEHVQVKVKLTHSRRGDILIKLRSPSGTWSKLLSPRPYDDSDKGISFTFMTVHSWSEDPIGIWQLSVEDKPGEPTRNNEGELLEWSLILYGTADSRVNRMDSHSETARKTFVPTLKEVKLHMDEEQVRTNKVTLTPYESFPVKRNESDGLEDSKFVENLIKALQDSKGSSGASGKTKSPDKRKLGKTYLSNWNRGDYVTEVKKSYNPDQMLDDGVLDELVDAMEKEFGTGSDGYKRTSEALRTEDDLEDVLAEVKRRLQLERRLMKQNAQQRNLEEDKEQQQLLKKLLEEVKKEQEEDQKAAWVLTSKMASQPNDNLDRLLNEARKMLKQKDTRQYLRDEGRDAEIKSASKTDNVGVDQITIRTLKDLLNYLEDTE
ncbi:PC3-like endoprotease variant B [Haliotis rufescens]|uniref:PC3-like endoprotease variant B n=1 Tax=Haliotis rufescens TaxID=6454 RepID=UPI00201F526B|nr:PC3-like endoprotease variant B [Haliotis rufescens]